MDGMGNANKTPQKNNGYSLSIDVLISYVSKPIDICLYDYVYSFQNDSVFNSCTSVHIIRLYFQAFSKVCVCVCAESYRGNL